MKTNLLFIIITVFLIGTAFASCINASTISTQDLVKNITIQPLGDPEHPYPPEKPVGETNPSAYLKYYKYKTMAIDPQDDQLYYEWNWDDSFQNDQIGPYASGETCSINHQWKEPGTYHVRVRAIDYKSWGIYKSNWSEALVVQVQDPPLFPPEKPDGPTMGNTEVEYTYQTSTRDPQGDQIWYRWRWYDGNNDNWRNTTEWIGPYYSDEICTATHTWKKPGTYLIEVQAKDSTEFTSDWSDPLEVHINVSNPDAPDKPLRPTGPTSGEPETTYTYTTATVDPQWDKIRYGWDWGETTSIEWTDYYNSDEEVSITHTWNEKGTYLVKVIAEDEQGNKSPWSDPLSISMPHSSQKSHEENQFLRLLRLLYLSTNNFITK